MRAFENVLDDLRQAYLSPSRPQHPKIALVLLDEETLAALPCRSPVDRGLLARLLRELAARKPLAIGLDILLDRPTAPAADAALREAMSAVSVPVVVAAPPGGIAAGEGDVPALVPDGIRGGDASLIADPVDGIVRHVRLRDPAGRPGFAAALAAAAGAHLPEGASLRLVWHRGPDAETAPFRAFPARAVALLPPEWLAGRIVLVGAVPDDSDRWTTPLSRLPGAPTLSGVEIHARALAQLLDGERVGVPPPSVRFATLLAAAALGLAAAARLSGPAALATVAVVVPPLWLLAGFGAFTAGIGLIPVAPPAIAFLAALGLAVAVWRRQEWAKRRQVERAFEHYLAPAVVRRLAAHPELLERGAERRELTILFTDLEGFTAASERYPPEVVSAFLADYLDGLVEIVFAHGGTVDKIVGDALHVFFGAPEPQSDDARRAVLCALDMRRFAEACRRRFEAGGRVFGRTRIGIDRGPVLVGNFGSRRRFDYTVHGDVVNRTARLEAANKVLGTAILAAEGVVRACPDLVFRPVGRLRLRGREQLLTVFEPLSDIPEWLDDYRRAHAAMAAAAPEARDLFAALARRLPDDPLVHFHLDRLQRGERGDLIDLSSSG